MFSKPLPKKKVLGGFIERAEFHNYQLADSLRRSLNTICSGVKRMNSGLMRRVSCLLRPAGGVLQSRQLQTSSSLHNSGFFGSFFERKVEQQQQSHSNQFARKERIIEVHSHSVKPDSIDKYLKNQETFQGTVSPHF